MNTLTSTIAITVILSTVLATMSFWLPHMIRSMEKLSPYECGFDPIGSARLPFSMHFFMVGILVMLFDLEIALLLPLPWGIQSPDVMHVFLLASTIIVLLTVGLVYEWVQGGLEWAE
uniref:NADH-ubiquinone oxidoreductase chain 3 n=1 Tax=Cyema atrum TaxID=556252 RepID=D1YUE5_9TELE|nr:NADH dehydrogenase subunit 3 [Cyema atrum]BAI53529.1 NADH dehydrogenase subunit 3 [Cyema atrum]